MYTLQRFMQHDELYAKGLHEFDAWAANFGDTRTELELQPSGSYKPVTRFCEFVNVADLMAMYRTVADVVLKDDLRQYVQLPTIRSGKRQIVVAQSGAPFKAYQRVLAKRIKAIENRSGRPQKGDDIILSVITDGRHSAIDLRFVDAGIGNEEGNKLNLLIENVHRIWRDTSDNRYTDPETGRPYPLPGAVQMIFSDLGTEAAIETRGFSAYVWIRDRLIAMGIPADQIAFMQHYKKNSAKQRLFNDLNQGRKRIHRFDSDHGNRRQRAAASESPASSRCSLDTLRYRAARRPDRAPGQPERRDRALRLRHQRLDGRDQLADARAQGPLHRHGDVGRSLHSPDRGCRLQRQSVRARKGAGVRRRSPDAQGRARCQIAGLERLRDAHIDDQHAIRRQVREAEREIELSSRRIAEIGRDIERRVPTTGDAFTMTVTGTVFAERKLAGRALMKEILTLVQLSQEGVTVIGSIGGFDLEFSGERFGRDEYRYTTVLMRTGADYEIDFPVTVTPLGAIARSEHALSIPGGRAGQPSPSAGGCPPACSLLSATYWRNLRIRGRA